MIARNQKVIYIAHHFTGMPRSHYKCAMYINFLTRELVLRYKEPLRLCMRNEILRSANARYHYSYLVSKYYEESDRGQQ